MPINVDDDLIAAASQVVAKLREQAQTVVDVKGRNLATEICSLFRPYVVQELSPQFADKRTRQWAISLAYYKGTHGKVAGHPIITTPKRNVIVGKSYELGTYYIATGLDDAARHIADMGATVRAPAEFAGHAAISAALHNLRGPISIGKGHATMRRDGTYTVVRKGIVRGTMETIAETWYLECDVVRLDVALVKYPKRTVEMRLHRPPSESI